MFSRRSALELANLYARLFTSSYRATGGYAGQPRIDYKVDRSRLYDFLFKHDYEAWFCNMTSKLTKTYEDRDIKGYIMKVHTGETLAEATPNWTWEQREKLGQQYLQNLAEDILNDLQAEIEALKAESETKPDIARITQLVNTLKSRLELDGYLFRDGRLLATEGDVLDVQEAAGLLEALYKSLNLANEHVTFQHLTLSDEHYISGRWGDCISNARNFLESTLREVATAHSQECHKTPLPQQTYEKPVLVRDYLQREGLLEAREKETLASIYGLLSNTGSHPYMAQQDQARLMRQLALTLAQFVMLRLKGAFEATS